MTNGKFEVDLPSQSDYLENEAETLEVLRLCSVLRADLMKRLQPHDPAAAVEYQDIGSQVAFTVKSEKPEPSKLLSLMLGSMELVGLLGRMNGMAAH